MHLPSPSGFFGILDISKSNSLDGCVEDSGGEAGEDIDRRFLGSSAGESKGAGRTR